MSNQLLAASGLIIGTTMIIRMNKAKYAFITAIPGIFMVFVTMIAGYQNIVGNFLPKKLYLLTSLACIVMVLMAIVIISAIQKWAQLLKVKQPVVDTYGDKVLQIVPE
jgi:carbon starvation protein